LKDREKELICAPAGQAGAGRKPSRGGHGARHIIEEAFQTQTGIPSALSVRDGEEHFKGVGRGQTALRVPGKRTRSTGWWGSEEAAMEQARRANGAWVRARGWRPAAVESGRPTDSTATFTPTSQSIASDWLVCFCDTD
jgi:hypothetical protein